MTLKKYLFAKYPAMNRYPDVLHDKVETLFLDLAEVKTRNIHLGRFPRNEYEKELKSGIMQPATMNRLKMALDKALNRVS